MKHSRMVSPFSFGADDKLRFAKGVSEINLRWRKRQAAVVRDSGFTYRTRVTLHGCFRFARALNLARDFERSLKKSQRSTLRQQRFIANARERMVRATVFRGVNRGNVTARVMNRRKNLPPV